jgi:hypothetical protein
MSDPVKNNLARCRLGSLNRVLLRVAVQEDVQFRHFGNPTAIDFAVKLDHELHSHSLPPPMRTRGRASGGASMAADQLGTLGSCRFTPKVKAWFIKLTLRDPLAVLEASFQILVLRPYHANIGKRLVKTPKVYFTDTGTVCHLAGLKDPLHAASGPMGGSLMETVVLMEIVKTLVNRGEEPAVYFWRTSAGSEVDIVVEHGGELVPIEVKLSSTARPAMATEIRAFQGEFGKQAAPGYVVHPGDRRTLPARELTPWMRYTGFVESRDANSSQSIDDIVYGSKD